jgi:hypothetical protein
MVEKNDEKDIANSNFNRTSINADTPPNMIGAIRIQFAAHFSATKDNTDYST